MLRSDEVQIGTRVGLGSFGAGRCVLFCLLHRIFCVCVCVCVCVLLRCVCLGSCVRACLSVYAGTLGATTPVALKEAFGGAGGGQFEGCLENCNITHMQCSGCSASLSVSKAVLTLSMLQPQSTRAR